MGGAQSEHPPGQNDKIDEQTTEIEKQKAQIAVQELIHRRQQYEPEQLQR